MNGVRRNTSEFNVNQGGLNICIELEASSACDIQQVFPNIGLCVQGIVELIL